MNPEFMRALKLNAGWLMSCGLVYQTPRLYLRNSLSGESWPVAAIDPRAPIAEVTALVVRYADALKAARRAERG
jgi:hypothetical protein